MTAAIGLEWVRALAERNSDLAVVSLVAGGVALCALGLLFSPSELGLGRRRLVTRGAMGALLGVVLVMPAFARNFPVTHLPPAFAAASICVSFGEEIAFRGAVFAVLRRVGGAPFAVVGSAGAFAGGHLLSHAFQFLLPVFGLGLLLGVWRWAWDDLAGPIVAHTVADLAL